MSKERPILFSGEMVRSILDGRKTQTRRVIKPQPQISEQGHICDPYWIAKPFEGLLLPRVEDLPMYCPYGQPGDLLWVRETWATVSTFDNLAPIDIPKGDYRWPFVWYDSHPEASASITSRKNSGDLLYGKTRSSIHMPRWASRITLRVTDVRVERVQEISHDDAMSEGVDDVDKAPYGYPATSYAVANFRRLWNSINAARGYSWDTNPWVWVVEFERVTP